MGQRAARDVVDAEVGEPGDVLLRDIAGHFDFRFARDDLHRLCHVLMAHVVEHDDVRARFHGLPDHVEVLDLDFDLADEGSVGFGRGDGLFDAAGRADVVVLQHDAVGEVVTVVVPAAAGDRVFFDDAVVQVTAYFSKMRLFGVVLRVSSSRVFVPFRRSATFFV